jgi:tetraacyldisaccharide 4'-kinase
MSISNPQTNWEKANRFLLAPIAYIWRLVVEARVKLYQKKFLKATTVGCPVISVGNITSGGTGKTPVVIDIANQYIKQGFTVGILSRGYKRKSKQAVVVVADGKNILATCEDAGDEPYMIAKDVPGAIVIVGSKRKDTAQLAVEKYKCNLIILDDGFSHLALTRNQDIVLIDYFEDPAKDALLPAGRLREPLTALARATSIVITKVPENYDQNKLAQLKSKLTNYAPQADIGACRFVADELRAINCPEDIYSLSALSDMPVAAFCGIAKPESFFATIADLKAKIVQRRAFSDHHWYSREDLDLIANDLATTNATIAVTTEKDFVRLGDYANKCGPLAYLKLKAQWLTPIACLNQTTSNKLSP